MSERVLRVLLTVASILAVATACGSSNDQQGAGMQPTISIAEANRRVDDYTEQGRQALSQDARLGGGLRQENNPCSDQTGDNLTGRVQAVRSLEVTGIDPAKIVDYFTAIRNWWQNNNFRVIQDNQQTGYVLAESTHDGFTMKLRSNDVGKLYLGVSSPCVWPTGAPKSTM